MRLGLSDQRDTGMTLVEFIVVVVLVVVLAALILPLSSSGNVHRKARITQTQKDLSDIRSAIEVFRHDYGYLPVSERTAGLTNADFTFGTFQTKAGPAILNGTTVEANNSEIMVILSAGTAPADTALNLDSAKRNPRRVQYFFPKASGDTRSPGMGTDQVFRDPWGIPYIITLDLDGDGKCKDAFYRRAGVSKGAPLTGLNPLTNAVSADGSGDDFAHPGSAMIWSFGPDGKIDPTERRDEGVNRANVVSWR